MPKPPQVLFIAPWLPKLSENFGYRELFGLRDSGVSVLGASVHAPELVWDDSHLKKYGTGENPCIGKTELSLIPASWSASP
jgi:hypothetical protein